MPEPPVPALDWALEAWANRVRANREQAERFREEAEPDFYAPVAAAFRADPNRTDDEALNFLLTLAQPGDSWLDIGAGAGRYALPLALRVREVIAVEPSEGMRRQMQESMAEHSIANIRVIDARWPMAQPPPADVALIAHVGYDVEEIGPFLDAMERAARRLCIAVMLDRSPATSAAPYFGQVHGEPRVLLPALRELLAVLLARGRLFEVRLGERPPAVYPTREAAHTFLRQQLFLRPGSEKDRILQQIVERLPMGPGGVRVSHTPIPLGAVVWDPNSEAR